MSDVAVMHADVEPAETPLTPDNWGKLGMWLFLAGDAMSFGCLIVGYGILRYASKTWPVPADVLGINLTALMTFLLIVSSVTMVLALAAVQEIHGFHHSRGGDFSRAAGLRMDAPDRPYLARA